MRITGGAFRSRALTAPRGEGTRPTSDRVREALFDILASRGAVLGARVLDLYAGTGALGIEAVSRGARSALLVESSRAALSAIAANVKSLGVGGLVRVVPLAVERSKAAIATSGPFDLILVDPPYALVANGASVGALEGLLGDGGLLAPGGILVLEHARTDASPAIGALSLSQARRYGDTVLSFYGRSDGATAVDPSGR